jgi:hypothetical protein
MRIEIKSPPGLQCVIYPLSSFEEVVDFRRILAHQIKRAQDDSWGGPSFRGFTFGAEPKRVYCMEHLRGITVCFTAKQWGDIKAAFDKVFSLREYASVWLRLITEREVR